MLTGKRTTLAQWLADGFESHILHGYNLHLDLFHGMLVIYKVIVG